MQRRGQARGVVSLVESMSFRNQSIMGRSQGNNSMFSMVVIDLVVHGVNRSVVQKAVESE